MSLLNRVRGYARVEMIRSVVGPVAGRFVNLAAGQTYWLRPDVVDELVLKGYGQGTVSKPYQDVHIERLLGGHQTVNLGTGEVTHGK
jgi:hypothetical protein